MLQVLLCTLQLQLLAAQLQASSLQLCSCVSQRHLQADLAQLCIPRLSILRTDLQACTQVLA